MEVGAAARLDAVGAAMKILRGHRAPRNCAPDEQGEPTAETVKQVLAETPKTLMLTITRKGADKLNRFALEALFGEEEPLDWLPCDPEANVDNFDGPRQLEAAPAWTPIFPGMRVSLTRNLDKPHSHDGHSSSDAPLRR